MFSSPKSIPNRIWRDGVKDWPIGLWGPTQFHPDPANPGAHCWSKTPWLRTGTGWLTIKLINRRTDRNAEVQRIMAGYAYLLASALMLARGTSYNFLTDITSLSEEAASNIGLVSPGQQSWRLFFQTGGSSEDI